MMRSKSQVLCEIRPIITSILQMGKLRDGEVQKLAQSPPVVRVDVYPGFA